MPLHVPPLSSPKHGNPSNRLGAESPPENCKERPGLQSTRGLVNVDGVDDVVFKSNDTSERKEDSCMQVTTLVKRDSRGHDATPPNLTKSFKKHSRPKDPGDVKQESWDKKKTAGGLEEEEKDAFNVNVYGFT